jgi:hypothetical protein
MKSKVATITLVLETFLSGTACLFSTFAKEAGWAFSVLYWTLRWELLADIYNGRKMDFPELTNTINIAKQSKNMPEEISNLNSRKIMYNIQLKIYLKHLTVKKELQRMQKIEKNTWNGEIKHKGTNKYENLWENTRKSKPKYQKLNEKPIEERECGI